MILWISFLILLSSPVNTKEIIVEPYSSNEVDLRSTQDVSISRSNTNLTCLDSSETLKETAFNRLKKAALSPVGKSKIQLKKRQRLKKFPHFIGSNLFDGDRKKCFSLEDVNLLAARREFERTMIPRSMPPTILDDKSVCIIMRYFSYGHLFIRRMEDCSTRRILRKAFFDTFGGFLHHYLLPVVKMSFYVGDVQLKTVRKVLDYYQKCRFFLNTNGNGWRSPYRYSMDDVKRFGYKSISTGKNAACYTKPGDDYCIGLNLLGSKDSDIVDEYMIIQLPRIDLEDKDGYLGNIWLPYERKTTYSLRSYGSAFLLVKFYKRVSLCYWQKRIPRNAFDIRFKQWISENLLGHLFDEEFYPSLGGLISLYRNLHYRHGGCNSTYTDDDNDNAMDKCEHKIHGLKEKRKSSKYIELESKSKSVCDRDWLQIVQRPELQEEKYEKYRNKHSKSKKGKTKNKDNSKKHDKSIEGSWSKWFKWFDKDISYHSRSLKKEDGLIDSKSPKIALNGDSNSSIKENWWQKPEGIIKCVLLSLLILFPLYGLFKLMSLCMDKILGVKGSDGDGCLSVMWKQIKEFFKKAYQVMAMFFAFILAKLRKCCDKTGDDHNGNQRQVVKSARRPKVRIAMDSTTKKDPKKCPIKKKNKSDSPENKLGKNAAMPKKDTKQSPSKTKVKSTSSQTNVRTTPEKNIEKNVVMSKQDPKKSPSQTSVKSLPVKNIKENAATSKKDPKRSPSQASVKSLPEKNIKKNPFKCTFKKKNKSASPENKMKNTVTPKVDTKQSPSKTKVKSTSSQTNVRTIPEKNIEKNATTSKMDSKRSPSQTSVRSTPPKKIFGKNAATQTIITAATSKQDPKRSPSQTSVKSLPEKNIKKNAETSKKDPKRSLSQTSVRSTPEKNIGRNIVTSKKDPKKSPSQTSVRSTPLKKKFEKNAATQTSLRSISPEKNIKKHAERSTPPKKNVGKNAATQTSALSTSPQKNIGKNAETSKKNPFKCTFKRKTKSASPENKMKNTLTPKVDTKQSPSKTKVKSTPSQTSVISTPEKNMGKSDALSKKDSKSSPSQTNATTDTNESKKSPAKDPLHQPDFTITITRGNKSPQTSRKAKIILNKNDSESGKRMLGGEVHDPVEMSSDSSNSKESWKTFYDF